MPPSTEIVKLVPPDTSTLSLPVNTIFVYLAVITVSDVILLYSLSQPSNTYPLLAGFAGADSNSVITGAYTDYDTIASATYSCEGMFNYVKVACSQYVNTDKALLTGGNA